MGRSQLPEYVSRCLLVLYLQLILYLTNTAKKGVRRYSRRGEHRAELFCENEKPTVKTLDLSLFMCYLERVFLKTSL